MQGNKLSWSKNILISLHSLSSSTSCSYNTSPLSLNNRNVLLLLAFLVQFYFRSTPLVYWSTAKSPKKLLCCPRPVCVDKQPSWDDIMKGSTVIKTIFKLFLIFIKKLVGVSFIDTTVGKILCSARLWALDRMWNTIGFIACGQNQILYWNIALWFFLQNARNFQDFDCQVRFLLCFSTEISPEQVFDHPLRSANWKKESVDMQDKAVIKCLFKAKAAVCNLY